MREFTQDDLRNITPRFNNFVGIDSDGCVFDTMEIKQKDFFHPAIIRHWGLEAIEPQVRAAAEFTYLYSKTRGLNRFIGLTRTLELLYDWDEARNGAELPDPAELRAYIESDLKLSNDGIKAEAARTGSKLLETAWHWSEELNIDIDTKMPPPPPFPGSVDGLKKIAKHSDAIVISQTQAVALLQDWYRDNLAQYVSVIAGPELGTKIEHFTLSAVDRYPNERILMIGDAPGDQKTAHAIGCCYFPINPGHEVESWKRFNDEAYQRFLDGTFAGSYQQQLEAEFDALLPLDPPWKQA